MRKETNIYWTAFYPVILPIIAIAPWWAIAKFLLKWNMSEYKIEGYVLFLTFFIIGVATNILNKIVKDRENGEKIREKLFIGHGKALVFIVGCEFFIVILIGILFLFDC